MFKIVLLGLLASASAAPHHYSHGPPSPFRHGDEVGLGDRYFSNDIFDTRRFWMELSREMAMFDQLLVDFAKRFPSSVSSEGIDTETNEYKVTIPLAGFEEKDIIVKAREGLLMVQAVQKPEGGIERSYLDIRSLPNIVNVNGSWTFNEGVLKIVFPLLSKPETEETTTKITTVVPEIFKPESREEIDNQSNDNRDADVGVNRGDTDKEVELMTNVIPKRQPVEATTYAVDLKDEVEFVPVRY
ncbi:unnamed protein product [Parnassius mnemosyne]|uniref:SHSP domain-containing protein n=1 Tax=Parnassius mnemosyne TaxID=213953 RepID=A0AAV1M7A7_9NEOP